MRNTIKFTSLFNAIALILFCLTFAVTIGYAQPGDRLSAAAKADFQKGDYNLCLSEYTALISAAPKNDGFYAERARCHYFQANGLITKSGDVTAQSDATISLALADAQKSLDLNANNTAALNVRGLVKSYKKDEAGAIADFSRSIEIDPKFFKAYMNRALRRDQLKDYEGAIADYTKFIELNPQISSGYLERGNSYFKFGKDTEAFADYTKAIELDPQNASNYFYRGNALNFLKKYPEAIADLNKAIELNPKYTYAYVRRGESKAALNKKTEAIADLTKAIELDPNNKQAADALARLNSTAVRNDSASASNNVPRRTPPSAEELSRQARSRTPEQRQISEEAIKSAKILGSMVDGQSTNSASTVDQLNFRLSLVTPESSFKSVFNSFVETIGASQGNSYNKVLKEGSEIIVMNARCGDGAYVNQLSFSLYKLDGKSSVNGEANMKDISPLVTSYLDYRAANRETLNTPQTRQRERALLDEIMKNLAVSRFPRKAECDPIPVALSIPDSVLRLEVDDAKNPLIGSKINDGSLYEAVYDKLPLHERKVLDKYGYNRFADTQDAVETARIIPGTKAVIFNGTNFSIYRINPSSFAEKPDDSKFDVLKTTPVPKGWKIVVIVYGTKVIRIYDPNAK